MGRQRPICKSCLILMREIVVKSLGLTFRIPYYFPHSLKPFVEQPTITHFKPNFDLHFQKTSSRDVSCQVEHLASHGTVDGAERRRLLKKSADLVDPETRYMDVTVWRDRHSANSSRDDSIVHIAVAGSDVCVRLVGLGGLGSGILCLPF